MASERRLPIVRMLGLLGSLAYMVVIVWVYGQQPRTLPQLAGGLASTVGAYRVDPGHFDEGLRRFHEDRFVEARAAFHRADPAARDAVTQFYIAYSYYRQGWGRVYHDNVLLEQGLEAVERAAALADRGQVVVTDPGLGMRTSDELRAEIEAGLARDVSDLNPLRVFRPRK